MSKRINVNPDHYKVAGRERQGENIIHQLEKQAATAQFPGVRPRRGRRRQSRKS
jgi:hypothetical protein